jgi:cell division protein FtsW
MLLILVEPNNGTVGVIALTLIMLCGLTQISVKYWAIPLLAMCLVGGLFAYNLAYVSARLKVYWNPELDLRGKGHQPYQAKIAAGSGKLWGKGPGNSLQKLSYLPEAQNDYIAAIYAEEFGFIGMMVLIALYMVIGYVGFFIAYGANDRGGFFLAASITFLFSFQAFMNLGVVSGLLPSTGLNLPLFSQGGTSLIANLSGLGLLLNVYTDR